MFIIDLLTKENFDRILNYIELINIKASQSKARAQKKQMLDIFTLSNEVKVKYGFQNFTPISSMLPNTSVLRKYTLPEYDQASDKGLLEYVETKKTLTENLSTNQESSSSKYINFQYPIPGGRYIQSNYKNQNTYQERTFSNNNNNNSPKNQEKSDNYDKANTISQISTNVKQYKSSYAHVTSLPNEHIEKIEQTPQKKLFTKENWNEIGVSLLQKRKRLNRLGASEVFDYLMSLCTQERSKKIFHKQ